MTTNDSLLETVEHELGHMIAIAKEYKHLISSAKTGTKRAYYTKKLTQIVGQVDQVMKAMDQYKTKNTHTTGDELNSVESVVQYPVYEGTSSEVIGQATKVTLSTAKG